jgi:hypothetical protein
VVAKENCIAAGKKWKLRNRGIRPWYNLAKDIVVSPAEQKFFVPNPSAVNIVPIDGPYLENPGDSRRHTHLLLFELLIDWHPAWQRF